MKPKCGGLLTNFTYMYVINETQNCDEIKIVANFCHSFRLAKVVILILSLDIQSLPKNF